MKAMEQKDAITTAINNDKNVLYTCVCLFIYHLKSILTWEKDYEIRTWLKFIQNINIL